MTGLNTVGMSKLLTRAGSPEKKLYKTKIVGNFMIFYRE